MRTAGARRPCRPRFRRIASASPEEVEGHVREDTGRVWKSPDVVLRFRLPFGRAGGSGAKPPPNPPPACPTPEAGVWRRRNCRFGGGRVTLGGVQARGHAADIPPSSREGSPTSLRDSICPIGALGQVPYWPVLSRSSAATRAASPPLRSSRRGGFGVYGALLLVASPRGLVRSLVEGARGAENRTDTVHKPNGRRLTDAR